METFYIIVLTIAAAILILILTTIGTMMRDSSSNTSWPPTSGRCPDGWTENANAPGNCFAPTDGKNMGGLPAMGKLKGTSAKCTSSSSGSNITQTLTFTSPVTLAAGSIKIGDVVYTSTDAAAGGQCTATCAGATAPKDIQGTAVGSNPTIIEFALVGTGATYGTTANTLTFTSPVALSANDIIQVGDQFYTISALAAAGTSVSTTNKNTTTPTISSSQIVFTVVGKDFTTDDYKTICDKKNWAKVGVKWDGISNYNKCP